MKPIFYTGCVFLLLSLCQGKLQAQFIAKNVIQAQAGTNILVSSGGITFERHLYSNPEENVHIYGNIGAEAIGIFYHHAGPGGMLGFTLLTGRETRHFEIMVGVFGGSNAWGYGSRPGFVFPLASLGYRHQPIDGGFMFRAFGGVHGLGIGVGYAF